ncbi:MAG TPA: hypothetical protein VGU46_00310 [Acidobacteriaceae bacterium]|nr:hypothetical protein [Acidobacteriaceae bacterium]
MQKTFRLLLIASAVLVGALGFNHWSRLRTLNSGEVHIRPEPQTAPAQPTHPHELASTQGDSSASGLQPQSDIASLPTSGPLSRNPSGSVVTVGTGKFQLYRQGDLTFRLNTETGQACVLFATDAQWRKPLVYDHGCSTH